MQPRIVFRTHYQIDEPAYMEFLIRKCTSPVLSNYKETVAAKLTQEIRARGMDLNKAASGYAVDLARALNLITPNHTWTDKGHLVDLIAKIGGGPPEKELELSLAEKLLHFRIFLEGDGAAMMFLARKMLQLRSAGGSDVAWNYWAREMFMEVYTGYLELAGTTPERVELRRKLERIKTEGYEGKTGSHKVFIHLHTLYRLGLLVSLDVRKHRAYSLPTEPEDSRCGLARLVSELPDLLALEKSVQDKTLLEVATRALGLSLRRVPLGSSTSGTGDVLPVMVPYYRQVVATGVPLCPLSTLIDAIQIGMLVGRTELVSQRQIADEVTAAQRDASRDIRFHVDRRGQPAFLKLSDAILEQYSGTRLLHEHESDAQV